jgi:Spy/CpxP family protein refolding chaperone
MDAALPEENDKMYANDASETPTHATGRRPIFWWPFTLIALTTALLFVAGRVSAWRGTDGEHAGAFRRHAERMLDRALDEVDATDEQALEIRAIGDEIFDRLATTHAERRSDGDALRAALSAEQLDRAALEAIRSAHVARADRRLRGLPPDSRALERAHPDADGAG